MQKKIIALAIAAAFSAPAFADTTVYGVVDAVVANVSASGTQSDTLMMSGGLAGSRLGVKSSEDLGSGMKASVVLEYALDVAKSAAPTAARQQMLALSGDFGTVAAGYLQTTGYDFSRFDPTAGSLVTPLGNITAANSSQFLVGNAAALKRASRALAYISPEMGGVTVALNYSTDAAGGTGNLGKADGTTGKTTAGLASVNYAQGPVAAAVVVARYMDTTAGATVTGDNETAVGASYDLEMAKLFATYQVNKADGVSETNKALSIGATVPVTAAGTAVVSYAKATMDRDNLAAGDHNASGFTLAWLQSMSKTTTAYAAYSSMGQGDATKAYSVGGNAIGGAAALANGTGSSMIAVGLNKKF